MGFKSNCQSAVKGSHSITPAKVANVFLPRFRNHYPSPLQPHVLFTDIIGPSHTFRPTHCKVHSFSLHSRSSIWAQSSSVCPLSCACLSVHLHQRVNVCGGTAKFALCGLLRRLDVSVEPICSTRTPAGLLMAGCLVDIAKGSAIW